MMNQKKHAGGVDPAAQFVSRISQPGRLAIYFASCLGISTLVYVVLGSFVAIAGGGLAITAGIYMGINFHHYVIDALISKRRPVITQSI